MQLWGNGDYCFPLVLIINLITFRHVERWKGGVGGSPQTNFLIATIARLEIHLARERT